MSKQTREQALQVWEKSLVLSFDVSVLLQNHTLLTRKNVRGLRRLGERTSDFFTAGENHPYWTFHYLATRLVQAGENAEIMILTPAQQAHIRTICERSE